MATVVRGCAITGLTYQNSCFFINASTMEDDANLFCPWQISLRVKTYKFTLTVRFLLIYISDIGAYDDGALMLCIQNYN